ncbi:hypothetical protein COU93_03795, partial [Candidatus Shapirobacteria bacterium CG10_big_fil_rev_8_21_14_0_10_36_6]
SSHYSTLTTTKQTQVVTLITQYATDINNASLLAKKESELDSFNSSTNFATEIARIPNIIAAPSLPATDPLQVTSRSPDQTTLELAQAELVKLSAQIKQLTNQIAKYPSPIYAQNQSARAQIITQNIINYLDAQINTSLQQLIPKLNANPNIIESDARTTIVQTILSTVRNYNLRQHITDLLKTDPMFAGDTEGINNYTENITQQFSEKWFIARHMSMQTLSITTKVDSSKAKNITAIGDIHGDWNQLIRMLSGQVTNEDGNKVSHPLVDKSGNWIGGPNDMVILTGDVFDRAPADVLSSQTAEKLMKLQIQAGYLPDGTPRIKFLLGNHDANAIYAYWTMVELVQKNPRVPLQQASEIASLTGIKPGISPQDLLYLYNHKNIADWLMQQDAITVHDGVIYMHSDIVGYLDYGSSISQINQRIKDITSLRLGKVELGKLTSVLTERGQLNTQNVTTILKTLGGKHIVHGHSENKTPMDNRVSNIDGGLSDSYAKKSGKGINRGRFVTQKIKSKKQIAVTLKPTQLDTKNIAI